MTHTMKLALLFSLATLTQAWMPTSTTARPLSLSLRPRTQLNAQVGLYYGSSTGSTMTVAETLYEAFGPDVAAEPVDIETLEPGSVEAAFAQHDALVVGTPTWNTGADTERSGTGWDELYYKQMPGMKSILANKPVAVFGLGDQESYADNYADAAGELYDVFESLGCRMYGAWSQEGYEHNDSKAIRGDKFCGLLLDMVNQEDLTEERVTQWVAQLRDEGFLQGGGGVPAAAPTTATASTTTTTPTETQIKETLEDFSSTLDENIALHSSGGYVPHTNPMTGKTMWTSVDGKKSFVTTEASKTGSF